MREVQWVKEVGKLTLQARKELGFEVVESNVSSTSLRLFGRVSLNTMPKWTEFVRQLLLLQGDVPWDVDVSKKYVLKDGKLVFGWRLQFKTKDMDELLASLATLVTPTIEPTGDIMELPLIGHQESDRVGLTGTIATGPAARR